MKKYSVISFNFSNYEILREPDELDPEAEYVYVTDNHEIKSDKWKVIYYKPNEDPIYNSFYVRYHPFEFTTTNTVIVLDGSIKIKKSLRKLYNDFVSSQCYIGLVGNSFFETPLKEAFFWKQKFINKKDSHYFDNDAFSKIHQLLEHYNLIYYKHNFEAGVKICKNNKICNDFNELVWHHLLFLGGSRIFRLDQPIITLIHKVFFNHIKVFLCSRQLIQNKYLTYCRHGTSIPDNKKIKDYVWFNNDKCTPYILN